MWIKDYAYSASAASPIVIEAAGSDLIDGEASFSIVEPGDLIRLYPLSDLSGWWVGWVSRPWRRYFVSSCWSKSDADERPGEPAAPSHQARAADDDGGDRVEFEARACIRLSLPVLRDKKNARDSGQQA